LGKTVFAFEAEWLPAPMSSRRKGFLLKARFKKMNLLMKEEENALKFMRKYIERVFQNYQVLASSFRRNVLWVKMVRKHKAFLRNPSCFIFMLLPIKSS
jgi:hypothetical protein